MNASPAAKAPGDRSPSGSKGALVGLLGLAVGLVVGYGAGRVSTGTPVNPLAQQKGGETGLKAVEQNLLEQGLLPPSPAEARALSGTVIEISGNRLTFDAVLTAFDPLGTKELPVRRTVTLTEATSFVRFAQKSPDEFAADQAAFREALANPSSDAQLNPPLPIKEVKASAADVKVGEVVMIEAAADILTASSFEAVRVILQPQIADTGDNDAPLPPPPLPTPSE